MVTSHGTLALASALRSLPACGVTNVAAAAVLLMPLQQLSGVSRWWHGGQLQHSQQQQQQLLPSLSVRHMAAHAQPEGSDLNTLYLSKPYEAVSGATAKWPGSSSAAAVRGPSSSGNSSSSSISSSSSSSSSTSTSSSSSRRRRRYSMEIDEQLASVARSAAAISSSSSSAGLQGRSAVEALAATGRSKLSMQAASSTPLASPPSAAEAAAEAADTKAVQPAASTGGSEPLDPFGLSFDLPSSTSSSSSSRSSSSGSPPSSSSSSSSSSSNVAKGGGGGSGKQSKLRRRKDQAEAAAAPPAAAADAVHRQQQQQQQHDIEPVISGEGEVCFPEGSLLSNITAHWHKLMACPSAASYTRSISFDEFGNRYIQQLEREERARCRAMDDLQSDLKKDTARGTNYSKQGGVVKRLMSVWQPLLSQAIAAEQHDMFEDNGRGASGRRDRPNYGPYLMLLEAEDLAHITLQTVLSKIATAVPQDEDGDATSWSGSSAAALGGSSTSTSSSSSAWQQQNPNSGVVDNANGGANLAAAVPAVVLAESVGRAVNSRLKYLKFKHHQHKLGHDRYAGIRRSRRTDNAAAAAAAAVAEFGSSGSDGGSSVVVPGDALQQQLASYIAAAGADAERYESGQRRIAALQELSSVSSSMKKATAKAMAGVRWEPEVRMKVGAALIGLLLENSHLPDGIAGRKPKTLTSKHGSSSSSSSAAGAAAFEYTYIKTGAKKQQAFVTASQGLVKVLLADRSLAAALLVKVPPMMLPPIPWEGYNIGGQLTSRHWMMRTRYSTAMQNELKKGMRDRRFDQVLGALNVLGNTAWRINPHVYAAMSSLWQRKSTAGGLPCQIPLKPPVPPPTNYRLVFEGGALAARGGFWSRNEKRGHVLACDDVRRLNRNMASLKADFLLKKQVADEYLDVPEFYYPHTVDFRGRAYPLHPSLHHLGDDNCRGLLMFARGRALGQDGLGWLYVHLANVWGNGVDKLSFDDRRAFAQKNLGRILDVARKPLKHIWWQEAEKPWQALAACCEIAGALESGTPSTYLSHLPVHMDGSCNGLQHYAALGRDEAGGKAVNLLPSDKPQDVYKGVAEIVARRVAEDAAGGNATARRCVNLIDRKLVKQTVMTSVYGVTAVGARAQVENRLKEKRVDMKAKASLSAANGGSDSSNGSGDALWPLAAAAALGDSSSGSSGLVLVPGRDVYSWMDDKDLIWQASKYLADQTLESIGEMFVSARAIMGWLADCARVVASADAPVRWSSPLGLPIMQPYHKLPTQSVATSTQSFSVVRPHGDGSSLEGDSSKGQWIKARQRSAFPPNFIHSIDSTHMMMTALECSKEGIEFAGVHDSFWTHAGTVPLMNAVLRDKFVKLHSDQPGLLENLVEQLQSMHPNLEFPPIPERGDLALYRVRNSKYFFS